MSFRVHRRRQRPRRAPVESLEPRRLLAAGDLDLGFGFMGKAATPHVAAVDDSGDAIALQSDGKILVGGNIWAGVNFPTLTRYLSTGAVDTTFGVNGTARATSLSWRSTLDIAVNNVDGTILSISSTASSISPTIQRFTSTGALDPTWIGPGVTGVPGRPAGVAPMPDGRIYFATQTTLARLNANGTLDTTFDTDGKIQFPTAVSPDFLRYDPYAILAQPDGSILVAGERFGVTTGAKRAFVRRYTSAGVLDTAWAGGTGTLLLPTSTTDSAVRAMKVQGSTNIIVAGRNGADSFAARFTPTGVMDTTFAGGTGLRTVAASTTLSDEARRLAIGPNNQVYLGGYVTDVGPYIAALTTTGTVDNNYDGNGILEQPLPAGWPVFGGANIATNSTNRIVMATSAVDTVNKTWDEVVTRYTGTGALDTTFNGTGMQRIDRTHAQPVSQTVGSVMQADGKLVQFGTSQYVAGNVTLTRLNLDGSLDTSFGVGGIAELDLVSRYETPMGAVVQSDGKIVVVGRTDSLVGPVATATWQYHFFVARFNANGTVDTTFGTNGVNRFQYADGYWGYFNNVAMLSSGAIVATGYFQDTLNVRTPIVAKFSSTGVLDMSYGGSGTGRKLIDLPGDGEFIQALMPYPGGFGTGGGGTNGLIIGGTVDTTASNNDRFVARLDDNGNYITTFGAGGVLTLDAAAADENVVGIVGFDPTAGFIQVGSTVGANLLVTRLNGNGTPSTTFGVNGTATVPLPAGTVGLADMRRTTAGEFLFAGTRTRPGTSDDDALLMRLTSAGALDTTFGSGGSVNLDFGSTGDDGYDVHIAPSGPYVIGGRRGGDVAQWAAARVMEKNVAPLPVIGRRALPFGTLPSFQLTMNGDLLNSVDDEDFIAFNLDTGERFATFNVGIGAIGQPTSFAVWTATQAMPDGQYMVVIPVGALSDSAGNEQGQYAFNLFLANGTSGADTYSVRRIDATNVRVTRTYSGQTSTNFTVPAPAVDFGTVLFLTGGSGDDLVTVDGAGGEIPAAAIVADGRAGNDTLSYIGQAGATFDVTSATIARTGLAGPSASSGYFAVENLALDTGTYNVTSNVFGKNIDVRGKALVNFNTTQRLGLLAISGLANVPAGGDKTIVTTGLSITFNGRLDLADNDLAIDYAATEASPLGTFDGASYSGVHGLLARAYNFSAWDGNGLRTSMIDAQNGITTLAPAEAVDLLGLGATETTVWNGVTVDGTTVLVKYTYAGDLNLDGLIDAADYGTIDNWIQFPGTDGYANGDFNFDGIIDAADYGIIDNNIQMQGPPL